MRNGFFLVIALLGSSTALSVDTIIESNNFVVEAIELMDDASCTSSDAAQLPLVLVRSASAQNFKDRENELARLLHTIYQAPDFPCPRRSDLNIIGFTNKLVVATAHYQDSKEAPHSLKMRFLVSRALASDPERPHAGKTDEELVEMYREGVFGVSDLVLQRDVRKILEEHHSLAADPVAQEQHQLLIGKGSITGKPLWFRQMENNLGVVLSFDITEKPRSSGFPARGLLIEKVLPGSVLLRDALTPSGRPEKGDLITGLAGNVAWEMYYVKEQVEIYGLNGEKWARPNVPISIYHTASGRGTNGQFSAPLRILAQAKLHSARYPGWCKGKFGFSERIPQFEFDSGYVPENVSGAAPQQLRQSESIGGDAANAVKSIANARAARNDVASGLSSIRSRFWRAWANNRNQPQLEKEYAFWLDSARMFNSVKGGIDGLVPGVGALLGGNDINLGTHFSQRELFEYLAINPCSPLKNPDNHEYLRSLVQAVLYKGSRGERLPNPSEIDARIRQDFGDATNAPDFEQAIIMARNTETQVASNPRGALLQITGNLQDLQAFRAAEHVAAPSR